MCSHGNGGDGHGHGPCSELVVDLEHYEHGMQYTMDKYIDKDKVIVLNEELKGSGVKILKPWAERMDKTLSVRSDVDEELLFCIPFTGNVKLTGITFSGPMDSSFPAIVRIFKDRQNMSFDECVQARPDQEMALKQDDKAAVDYPLMAGKFSSVSHLTLHFPGNFGDEKTMLYYIGLRGEFKSHFRDQVNLIIVIVIATYEARPVPDDHKIHNRDTVNHQECTKEYGQDTNSSKRRRSNSMPCSNDE